jgi:hypothetical protein
MALMPMPPRPCKRYWSMVVFLAYPPSVTVKTYSFSSSGTSSVSCSASWDLMTVIESSSSSPRNFIPVTPDVARPIGRSWVSSARKRIA